MDLLANYDKDDLRQMFVATSLLGIIFLLCCFFWLVLWLLTGLFILLSIWIGFRLFGQGTERKRLNEAFKLVSGKKKAKKQPTEVKE